MTAKDPRSSKTSPNIQIVSFKCDCCGYEMDLVELKDCTGPGAKSTAKGPSAVPMVCPNCPGHRLVRQ